MKKLASILLALGMVFSLAACGGDTPADDAAAPAAQGTAGGAAEGGEGAGDNTYELAVVTDSNSIDDRGFNQGAWEGLAGYAEENGISHQYYRPIDQTTNGYLVAIETAIQNGAKLVVCPGYLFEEAVYLAQDQYPDVKFIILDGVPQNGDYSDYKTADNTYSIVFAEEQSGFLAGYAAVKDGYRELGFFGAMAVPAVVRFGYGYVQGADHAAQELGLAAGEVNIRYSYTGTFEILPENQTKAASWYQSGTEVIFGCGVPDNVFAAAESVGDVASIGVDMDMSGSSDTVVTSAMKDISQVIYDGITLYYAGEFPGGVNAVLGVEANAVALPMSTSRFESFSQADYDSIYSRMQADEGGIVSSMLKDADEAGNSISVQDVAASLQLATVDEIS